MKFRIANLAPQLTTVLAISLSLCLVSCEESHVPRELGQTPDQESFNESLTETESSLQTPSQEKFGKFLTEVKQADIEDRDSLIKRFESMHNIDLASNKEFNEMVLSSGPTYEQLIEFEELGPQTKNVYSSGGHVRNETVSWDIVRNIFGFWSIKSYERVTYHFTIQRVIHLESKVVGIHGGIVSWDELYDNVYLGYPGAQAIVEVYGIETIAGVASFEVSGRVTIRANPGP